MNILVRCPYCAKTHKHGEGTAAEPLSFPMTRSAHCFRGEYEIRASSGELVATPLVPSLPSLYYTSGETGNQGGRADGAGR